MLLIGVVLDTAPRATSPSEMSDPSRQFDLVLLGASGSVGNVMAQYFAAQLPSTTRWAIAGRAGTPSTPGRPKLKRRTTATVLNQLNTDNPPSLVYADAEDPDSMNNMARLTTVLVTTVGPYTEYGEAAVRACVEEGTHYVDITGEAFWVQEMRDKYGEAAKAKGVCIVSFAGYDCVPFEMSAYLAHRALSTTNNTQLVSAESLTTLSGGLPRGTLLTCVGMPGLGLLRVNTNWMRYLPSTERLSFARDVLLWALPWWSYQSGGLTIPEGMGMVACTIVHHSAPRLGYPNLRYNSRTDVLGSSIAFCQISGTIWATLLSVLFFLGLLPTLTMYVLVMPLSLPFALLGFPLLLLPPTRNMALKFIGTYLNYGGDANTTLIVRTRAKGANGSVCNIHLELPGDPGIHATAVCCAETALALLDALRSAKTGGAPPLPAGFTTPAHAVGDALAARLKAVKGACIETVCA